MAQTDDLWSRDWIDVDEIAPTRAFHEFSGVFIRVLEGG